MYHSIIHLDHQLFYLINTLGSNPFFDSIMPIIRNKLTWIPLYIVVLILLIQKEKIAVWKPIIIIISGVLLSNLISATILKDVFDRVRPCTLIEKGEQIRILINCSNGFSFPSAHATNHACLAVLFSYFLYEHYRYKIVYVFFASWAWIIAYAQVYVGVHYPLDVIAGILLGAVIGLLLAYLLRKKTYNS